MFLATLRYLDIASVILSYAIMKNNRLPPTLDARFDTQEREHSKGVRRVSEERCLKKGAARMVQCRMLQIRPHEHLGQYDWPNDYEPEGNRWRAVSAGFRLNPG